MSGADDYGKRQREPIFSVRNGGQPTRAPASIALDGPARDIDDEAERAHLQKVHEAVAQLRGPEPPTRLQAIAELLAVLPYGDMMELAQGCCGDAAGIFNWATANVRGADVV
jgi:hypothetical protein